MTDQGRSQKRGKPKRKRANREGAPWLRGDGRWCVRIYPPEGSIDARARYLYGQTRAEVMRKYNEAKAEQARGLPSDPDQTIGDYMHRWLTVTLPQYVQAGELARSTADSYQLLAEKHIVPAAAKGVPTLAHIGLRQLTGPMVRQWQDELSRKPTGRPRRVLRPGETVLPPPAVLSARTVAYCRAILHKAIADAVRDEVAGLQRNVVDLVNPAKDRQKKAKRAITPDQAAALLVAMGEDTLWCYWLLAFAIGFRRGEGLGMRWEDIDLEAQTWQPVLTVQRMRGDLDPATGKRRGKLVAKALKTEASGQKIALPVSAAEALAKWKTQQAQMQLAAPAWAGLGLVFTTSLGTALEPRNVNRAWEAVCARAGVPNVRVHDLRHACASYLLAKGADSKSVQRTLRHSRLATTELYLHAIEEVPRAAANAMDEVLADLRAIGPKRGARG